jgi:hypothetical protein
MKKTVKWQPLFVWYCEHRQPTASGSKTLKLGSHSYEVCTLCSKVILRKAITHKGKEVETKNT